LKANIILLFSILAAVLIFFITPSVNADVGYNCIITNSTTYTYGMYHNWTETTYESPGPTKTIEYSELFPCQYGCINGHCTDAPENANVWFLFIIGMGILSFVMAYMALNMDKDEHGLLSIFFFVMSFAALINVIGVMAVVQEKNTLESIRPMMESTTTVWTWALVFFIGYLSLYVVWKIFLRLKGFVDESSHERRGGNDPIQKERI